MGRYRVEITEKISMPVDVEALSAEEALDLSQENGQEK